MTKLGYFLDSPWSHKAIKYITTSGLFEVVFIVPRFDTQDRVLKSCAEKLCIPFIGNTAY
jgi:methionyl-tRNA formyltransferase